MEGTTEKEGEVGEEGEEEEEVYEGADGEDDGGAPECPRVALGYVAESEVEGDRDADVEGVGEAEHDDGG